MRKSTNLADFSNPKIPGLGRRQSWDSGLAKTAGIPGFGITGLQSLIETNKTNWFHQITYMDMNSEVMKIYPNYAEIFQCTTKQWKSSIFYTSY